MIERIGILVAGILGMIKKGDYKEAWESLDEAYQDVLKEDAAFSLDKQARLSHIEKRISELNN